MRKYLIFLVVRLVASIHIYSQIKERPTNEKEQTKAGYLIKILTGY